LTETRLGYSYSAPPSERRKAVAAWRRYLAQSATTGDPVTRTARHPLPGDGGPGSEPAGATQDWSNPQPP
jgi:hypothetical protein